MPNVLKLTAGLRLQASTATEGEAPRQRRFSMIGYTGGPMWLDGFDLPVVVDLSGLTVNSQRRPILCVMTWLRRRRGHALGAPSEGADVHQTAERLRHIAEIPQSCHQPIGGRKGESSDAKPLDRTTEPTLEFG